MKITHLLLATLFFVMSCTSEQKSANETKIEDEKPLKVKISVPKEKVSVDKFTVDEAMRQLAKKAQNFTIEADKDKTIICAEGTKITLQANSLVDEKTGKPVQGKVNVQVTEYYKISDIIIASLSTTSNDKLLETAGMINIEAFSNGKKLRLKDGATAQISFPTKKKKEGMKLFNGEWKNGVVNWVLSDVPMSKVKDDVSYSDLVALPFIASLNYMSLLGENDTLRSYFPQFPGGEGALDLYIKKNLNYKRGNGRNGVVLANVVVTTTGDIANIQIIHGFTAEMNTEAVRLLQSMPKFKQPKHVANYKMQIQIRFEHTPIADMNTTTDFKYTYPEIKVDNNQVVASSKEYLDLTYQLNYDSYSDEGILQLRRTYKFIGVDFNAEYRNKLFGNAKDIQSVVKKKREKAINEGEISIMDASNYVFNTNRLGFINCDKYLNSNRYLVPFKVKLVDDNVRVVLIFKNIQSLFSSNLLSDEKQGSIINGTFTFNNMPLNEPITILAIKSENGKTYIATKDSKITKEGESNLEFKLATLKELKKVLEGLDR